MTGKGLQRIYSASLETLTVKLIQKPILIWAFDEDIFMFRTLKLSEKVLGLEYIETLIVMNNLSIELRRRGKYLKAEQMLQQTIKLTEKVQGQNTPTR